MRLLILTFILTFITLSGFSQNIVDFFETIPDTSILGLSTESRKEIAKYSLDNKSIDDAIMDLSQNNISYAFDIIDIRNGYLRMMGAIEGHIQMCYWNLKNGNKLVAIYFEGCGPVCFVEQFDFYEFNGKDFTAINWQEIIPSIYDDFFKNKESNIEEMEEKDILATLLFDLPQTGKNIIAKWGNEDLQETYKKYGHGDRMKLIWNDGKFNKGEIFWE